MQHGIRGANVRTISIELQLRCVMGMPVKLSDELVESAREEAASTDRSITGQIEHWAKIGRSVETVLRHQDVQTLKRSPLKAQLTGGMRNAIQAVLDRVVSEDDRPSLARSLQAGRAVYQSDPAGSGLIERIEPDGSRTLGRLVKRRFVPADPTRVARR
jgi:hypothetical protein